MFTCVLILICARQAWRQSRSPNAVEVDALSGARRGASDWRSSAHHGWRRRRGGWDPVPAHGETGFSVRISLICVFMKHCYMKRVIYRARGERAAPRDDRFIITQWRSVRFAWLLSSRWLLSSSLVFNWCGQMINVNWRCLSLRSCWIWHIKLIYSRINEWWGVQCDQFR